MATDSLSTSFTDGDAYERVAADYQKSVIQCQQAIDQLGACKHELRRITGADGGSELLPDLRLSFAVAGLSKREQQVFSLMGEGLLTHQIAERLDVKISTVETYRERLKRKLKIQSGAALNRMAVLWLASRY
jgi:DNA-binding NarL/FixJ family response regulator